METNGYIRRATKADRDAIISIIPAGEYGDGGDYIPDYFDMLMDNPLFDAYVYIINDTIIGLGAIFIIDDRKTRVLRSGRIRKDFQGKGIMGKINNEISRNYPEIKYFVSATAIKLNSLFDAVKQGRMRVVAKRNCAFYSGSLKQISVVAKDKKLSQATVLQEKLLQQLFREQKSFPSVFQDERLVIDSVPYRIIKSNIPVILSERTHAVVTLWDNKNQTLLTFGSCFRQPTGELYCKIDIYGYVGESLQSHILRHLNIAMEIVKDFSDVCKIELRSNTDALIGPSMNEIGLSFSGTSNRSTLICIEQVNPFASKL